MLFRLCWLGIGGFTFFIDLLNIPLVRRNRPKNFGCGSFFTKLCCFEKTESHVTIMTTKLNPRFTVRGSVAVFCVNFTFILYWKDSMFFNCFIQCVLFVIIVDFNIYTFLCWLTLDLSFSATTILALGHNRNNVVLYSDHKLNKKCLYRKKPWQKKHVCETFFP